MFPGRVMDINKRGSGLCGLSTVHLPGPQAPAGDFLLHVTLYLSSCSLSLSQHVRKWMSKKARVCMDDCRRLFNTGCNFQACEHRQGLLARAITLKISLFLCQAFPREHLTINPLMPWLVCSMKRHNSHLKAI